MKIKLLTIITLGLIFTLIGCKKEEPNGEEATMNAQISLSEDVMQRAQSFYGDSWTATQLAYFVYVKDAEQPFIADTVEFDPVTNKKTLSIPLPIGFTYEIVYIAFSGDFYTYDKASRTVTAGNEFVGNNEKNDIFALYQEFEVHNNFTANAVLKRIVAQINLLDEVNDFQKAYYSSNVSFYITVDNEYPSYNIKNDHATGTPATKEHRMASGSFTEKDITTKQPGRPNITDGNDYVWLGFLHLFTTTQTTNVRLDIHGNMLDEKLDQFKKSYEISNVPLETNYRTNIFGKMFCGTGDFTLIKDPTWSSPDNDKPITSFMNKYYTMFDNATDNANWHFYQTDNAKDRFMIGTDPNANNHATTSNHALYITVDGVTNGYDKANTTTTYRAIAYRKLYFDANASYLMSISWKNASSNINDEGRFFIIDCSVSESQLQHNLNITSWTPSTFDDPDDWDSYNCEFHRQIGYENTWTSLIATLNPHTSGWKWVIFYWRNSNSEGSGTPLTVDMLSITATGATIGLDGQN